MPVHGKKIQGRNLFANVVPKGDHLICPTPTLLLLRAVAAYSCFTGSWPSIQLGGHPPGLQWAKWGQTAATCEEHENGLLQGPDELIGAGLQL